MHNVKIVKPATRAWMTDEKKLSAMLLIMRLSIFLVMLMWTFDKFLNPTHAAKVFETFYFTKPFGPKMSYVIGLLELIIVVAFGLGYKKRVTYFLILLFNGISTVACYSQYLAPFQGANLLYFAAWPMLAACLSLYVLRENDVLWVIE